MKQFSEYLSSVLFGAITIIIAIMVFNYLTDFYGIFELRTSFKGLEPNQRSLKVQQAVKQKNDLLIFSDSRGGVIDPIYISDNAYNMSYSMGTPEEFLEDIQFILDKGSKPKQIVIMLDQNFLFHNYLINKKQALRKFVDLDNKSEKFQFLALIPSLSKISRSLINKESDKYLEFMITTSGVYREVNYENCQVSKQINFIEDNKIDHSKDYQKLFNKKINVLENIRRTLVNLDIDLILVNHPISSMEYLEDNENIIAFNRFIEKCKDEDFEILSLDTNLFEFDCNWRDKYHYRSDIGSMLSNLIAERINEKITSTNSPEINF